MSFRSLRSRLLIVQSLLVVGLTVAALACVGVLANLTVSRRIAQDLAQSREVIAAAERERYSRLGLMAQLVASFPGLKDLLATDAATIRDFLADYRQQHQRDELLVAIGASGRVIGGSGGFAPTDIPGLHENWIEPTLRGQPPSAYLEVDGRVYQAAIAAAESGGTIYGLILAALPVDTTWAAALRDITDGREVVILSSQGVAGTTIPLQRVPWKSSADLSANDDGELRELQLEREVFQAVLVPAAANSPVRIVIVSLQSRDLAFAPYRIIQVGLLVLGVIAAAAGIGGSAVFARSLTRPIGELVRATQQVSAGSYDVSLDTSREDEIGDLARAFKTMTEGLRERADMLKFVSHSTVAMIKNRVTPERERGERREVTLLFCDIRGFTTFAEHHPPEEAVQVLNRYLHLQADLVQRFHGDVDKFMGDAVFAHFTGPDMAFDAIRCAVEIQRAVDRVSVDDPTLPPLAVGIGIATGEVIVGSIGSHDRLDYTAIGPAVNLSNRLCAAAEPREILISEETYERVRDVIAAEAVPPLTVKGFASPVRAYRMAVTPIPAQRSL